MLLERWVGMPHSDEKPGPWRAIDQCHEQGGGSRRPPPSSEQRWLGGSDLVEAWEQGTGASHICGDGDGGDGDDDDDG